MTLINHQDLKGLTLTNAKKMLDFANKLAHEKLEWFNEQGRQWHPTMDAAHRQCVIDVPAPFIPHLVYALRLRNISPMFAVKDGDEEVLVHADMDDYYDTVVAETAPGFCVKAEHMDDLSSYGYYVATASKRSDDWKYLTYDSGGDDMTVLYETFSDHDVVAVHLDYEDGWITRTEWDAIKDEIEDGSFGELSMVLGEYRERGNQDG